MQVVVFSDITNVPIENATISISYSGEPNSEFAQLTTDASGLSPIIDLPAPPIEYSMEPSIEQPYSEYTLRIDAPGYETLEISGSEILPTITSNQPVALTPIEPLTNEEAIVIPPHTLYYEYPPKIPESEIKPIDESGEIVLSRVVVPEIIVVHDGPPNDTSAKDYYVRYRDYIKNVASSEIYSTWPDAAIRANVLAIMSFTLNRVYTEWYRNRGYNFTITSSTAYDQKWINGRNYFEPISRIVDEIFNNYISRPNVKQPILTQYCDGRRVSCPNWLSQWGSKSLADQGYSTSQILRYYYGQDVYINSAEEISGIPSSWPGENLTIGSSGIKVRQMQEQLNLIGEDYRAIPQLIADGIFGESTQAAVRKFQEIFDLPVTGIVDFPTWYKISDMYVRLSRIAELN
ncbi:MAG: peptidoglycan-binding protein [Lachnospiraceae bacterium]|nr:peptidoglycan-binding protein [Lachnospiraceae bacterium]